MQLLRDLKFALRTLRKSPVFTLVAVISLAFGVGANTAIFSLINQVLLQNLPIRDPERLVLLSRIGIIYGSNTGRNSISYPMYQAIRDNNQIFDGMFCRRSLALSISFEGKTERVDGELVSGNFFNVLGIGAALGHVFTAEDDLHQGAHPYLVISYGYWQSHFGGKNNVLGKKLIVNGTPMTIIGVSQRGFESVDPGGSPQIRLPMMMQASVFPWKTYSLWNRRGQWVNAFGSLKPGITVQQAKAALAPFYHQQLEYEVLQPDFNRATPYVRQQFLAGTLDVLPASNGRDGLRRQFEKPLLVLMGVVALVLLIACANVANLLIARAAARQKEMAVRAAMGASRTRIVSQLVTESLLLSFLGGAAGFALAIWLDRFLVALTPSGDTSIHISTTPDWRVLPFTFGVTVLTGLIFGLAPALQTTRLDLAETLKDQAGAVVSGGSVRIRKMLVIGQVALSLLLLIGAGLFIRTLRNLRDLDPGFRIDQLDSFTVDPHLNGYPDTRSLHFFRQLRESMDGLPGVQSASLAVVPVLTGEEWDSSITIEGYHAKDGENMGPHMNYVSPDHFRTMAIPVKLGRDFNERDETGSPKVAIVNQKFVKRYLGDQNPIGHRIGMGSNPGTKTDITIVGVAGDTKYEDLRQEVPVELYLPYTQSGFVTGMTAYVRTSQPANSAFMALRGAVHNLDPDLPMYHIRTLTEQANRSLITERLVATLASTFGILATILAAIGLYGVMAYTVTRRTREIGIRMALGATRGSVAWLVMREVLFLLAIGLSIGIPAALGLSRFVQAQLYGIKPADAATMSAAIVGIAVIAILAGYLPGRRATRIDPMQALRWE
jgi:predicted permease